MKRLLLIVALLLLSSPAWATWAVVQHTCNAACVLGSATCAITTSATGSNNLIVVAEIVDWGGFVGKISSVSGGGIYTPSSIAANSPQGAVDMAYTLASTSGDTSITITLNTNVGLGNTWRACMTELSSSNGGIALDTGVTPQANRTITSAAPVGPALTVSGANLAVVGEILWSGTITGASSPYNLNGDQPNGNGWANAINISVGTAVAWTPTTSFSGISASIAFQENTTTKKCTITLLGAGPC